MEHRLTDIRKKQCIGPCGQEYDATVEYFHRSTKGLYGLNSKCRACRTDAERWKECENSPKGKARRQEYEKRPEVKARRQNYGKEYRRDPEVKARRQEHYNKPETIARRQKYNNKPEVIIRRKIKNHIRRARKKSISGTHTPAQIQDQLKRQRHKCYYCQARLKKTKGQYIYHIEHTFPLSRVAGTDIPANSIDYIVLACPHCNDSKGSKFPWEWPEGGRLL